jgi:hypothetical protein
LGNLIFITCGELSESTNRPAKDGFNQAAEPRPAIETEHPKSFVDNRLLQGLGINRRIFHDDFAAVTQSTVVT